MGLQVAPTDNIKIIRSWAMYKKNLIGFCIDGNAYAIPVSQVPVFINTPIVNLSNIDTERLVQVKTDGLKMELLRQYYWGTQYFDQLPSSDVEVVCRGRYRIKYAVPFIIIQDVKSGVTYTLFFKVRLGRKLNLNVIYEEVLAYSRKKDVLILSENRQRKEPVECTENLIIGLNDAKYGFVAKYEYTGLSDDKHKLVTMNFMYIANKWIPQRYQQKTVLGYSFQ